jgi:hypothetical protein
MSVNSVHLIGNLGADPESRQTNSGTTVCNIRLATTSRVKQGEEWVALLAEHGLDLAKWERVQGVWTDRMSKDTSGAIAMAYSKAFGGAGAGQFGGAAAQGAAVMNLGSVVEAGGDEPVPFERLCEIQGAMTAWSNSGQDVNAMLKHSFDMNAQDWSSVSMWWMTKMQSDMALMQKYSELSDKYAEQYGANAGSGADDDLSF